MKRYRVLACIPEVLCHDMNRGTDDQLNRVYESTHD